MHTNLTLSPSEDDGWTLDDGVYNPVWFDGPQLPDVLVLDEN